MGTSFGATEVVIIIGALGAMLVQIITALKTNAKVKETHDAVNSRMDKFLAEQQKQTAELLRVAKLAAHAQGVRDATDIMAASQPVVQILPHPIEDDSKKQKDR